MKLLFLLQSDLEIWIPPAWYVEKFRLEFPQIEFEVVCGYENASPYLPDAEVIVTWTLRSHQFAEARKLRWIHSPAAALHGVLIPEVVASDVLVTNSSDVYGSSVSEHAMAMLLAMARHLPSSMRYQQRHEWAQERLWMESPQFHGLDGAVLGLIGVGAIGREIARRALAFGMRICAVREHPERGLDFLDSPASSRVELHGFDQLDSVVENANYLVLAAPVAPRTRGLMSAQRIARMKPNAYLINVSRGALVDEAALIEALRNRRIAGAALDVFRHEPLASDSPLWELPNVLITPHIGALTDTVWERHYSLLSENLRRYMAGQPLLSLANKNEGY
jgi:phosphoglycerate dehydrogenase-like enzyme